LNNILLQDKYIIGVLFVIIRTFGGYPDGVAFAVLLKKQLECAKK
jgi:Na+-translocating ferredoxin:NAD+ oxidoreductase RnfD subunit